jgi:hypothetical protein
MIARPTNEEERMPTPKRRKFWLLVLPMSVATALPARWLGWGFLARPKA